MGHYPGSKNDYRGRATTYGPLPSHGKSKVSLVLHTTETKGMPSFGNGDTAPHYVYDPRDRSWYVWAEWEDGYVGTMKGHTTGGHGNCQAFQVEILAYSDKSIAQSVGGLWVGDLDDTDYQHLAAFYAWAMDRYGIGPYCTPTPAGGWRYGTSSPHRMSVSEWDQFSGLTAHGAVPGNTHWDTGVLDLVRIADIAGTDPNPPPIDPPDDDTEADTMYPMYETDGYTNPSGKGRTYKRDDVTVLQGLTNDAGGNVSEDGKLGPSTIAAIASVTGIPVEGGTVTGAHGNALRRRSDGNGGGGLPDHTHTLDGTTGGVAGR